MNNLHLALLLTSVFLNLFLFYLLIKNKKKPVPTKDAQMLLKEILTGKALVSIEVMDPSDILIRSPHR